MLPRERKLQDSCVGMVSSGDGHGTRARDVHAALHFLRGARRARRLLMAASSKSLGSKWPPYQLKSCSWSGCSESSIASRKLIEAGQSAYIFGRTFPGALDKGGISGRCIFGQDLLDAQLVFPAIAHVVEIAERLILLATRPSSVTRPAVGLGLPEKPTSSKPEPLIVSLPTKN